MKKMTIPALALTVAVLLGGCAGQPTIQTQTEPVETVETAKQAADLVGRMAGLTADEILEITSIDDRIPAEDLAAAVRDAAASPAEESEIGTTYYSLEAFLSGGPEEGYGSEDERLAFRAGLKEDLVEASYFPKGGGQEDTLVFDAPSLYALIRDSYRPEIGIDQAEFEKYQTILSARAEENVANSKKNYGDGGFDGYEITRFQREDTILDGRDVYDVFRWNVRFVVEDPDRVLWVGGMYLDGDERVDGYEQCTYFVVKNPGEGTEAHRFLYWDLFLGATPSEMRENARDTILAAFTPDVTVAWADDVLSQIPQYDEFSAGVEASGGKVVFTAKEELRDFRVLSLSLKDVSEDGKPTFLVKDLYVLDTFRPERPLAVEMTLFGTIPNNGISYVDNSGMTRYYSVNLSGADGSLILTEF